MNQPRNPAIAGNQTPLPRDLADIDRAAGRCVNCLTPLRPNDPRCHDCGYFDRVLADRLEAPA